MASTADTDVSSISLTCRPRARAGRSYMVMEWAKLAIFSASSSGVVVSMLAFAWRVGFSSGAAYFTMPSRTYLGMPTAEWLTSVKYIYNVRSTPCSSALVDGRYRQLGPR
jgi:hypothetical protein